MSTIIWVSDLEVESQIHQFICEKINIESFHYSSLDELSEFLVKDLKPTLIMVDEANFTKLPGKFNELFSELEVKKILITFNDIEKPESITSILKMPINVEDYKDYLLKLSI